MKVSVIVPVYNAGNQLPKAVESLLAQTLSDREIILVDDGSTDESAGICDRFAAENSCIRVIHKPNGGVSAARQTGLEAALGDYVIGTDADDWVEPEMLERLYDKAVAEQADVVICDYFVDWTEGRQSRIEQQPVSLKPDDVLRQMFRSLHGSCCNKLVRREILMRYGVRFPQGIDHGEDFLFWTRLFLHDDIRIGYLPQAFYHYVQHEQSMTNAYTRKTWENRLRYADMLEKILPKNGYEKEIRKARLDIFFDAFTHRVLSKREAWMMLLKNARAAFFETGRFRWWFGYVMLLFGCFHVARKKLRY